MKKNSNGPVAAKNNIKQQESFPGEIKNHEHIHAANCGHPSFVHGDHIDYLHDGHHHYYWEGKTFHCEGPTASKKMGQVIPLNRKK